MPRARSVLRKHRIEHLTHKALLGLGQLGDGLLLLLPAWSRPALAARCGLLALHLGPGAQPRLDQGQAQGYSGSDSNFMLFAGGAMKSIAICARPIRTEG